MTASQVHDPLIVNVPEVGRWPVGWRPRRSALLRCARLLIGHTRPWWHAARRRRRWRKTDVARCPNAFSLERETT